MRFTSFAPAVVALSLFSASTQALPALSQDPAVALLKRGGGPGLLDAVVKVFADVHAKAVLDACVELDVDVCAAVDIKLNAKANVANIVNADILIKKAEVDVKAKVDVDIKANIRAVAKATVIANIDAHVRAVVGELCSSIDSVCLHNNAHAIVANVNAKIRLDIDDLAVKIRAGLDAFVKARVDVHIKELKINVLNLIKANASAIIRIKADVKAHLQVFVQLCVELVAKVNLVARIGAL
ncbi:hypothetical protein BGZ67_009031 [Mortierella alpina]|nr:hypothetical protein BGZ67_009031 [Mortierella alpina]